MSDWSSYRPVNSVVISPWSPESMSGEPLVIAGAQATAVWPAASRAIAWPFVVYQPITVTKLWIQNGANIAGNWDVGLYTVGLSQITNMTATMAGATANQTFDITDTALNPGVYYIAAAQNNAAASVGRSAPAVGLCSGYGVIQMVAAFPLPATITASRVATAFIPIMGALVGPRTAF